ncbi:hypothetical protein ACOSQ3_030251 [Xanthoceras sorbifolium]
MLLQKPLRKSKLIVILVICSSIPYNSNNVSTYKPRLFLKYSQHVTLLFRVGTLKDWSYKFQVPDFLKLHHCSDYSEIIHNSLSCYTVHWGESEQAQKKKLCELLPTKREFPSSTGNGIITTEHQVNKVRSSLSCILAH